MAKYTQQGMFDKLSEFSNSRKNKTTLKKYNGGGENSCEPFYKWDSTLNKCVPFTEEEKANYSLQYMRDWTNSPMHKEMLTASVAKDAPLGDINKYVDNITNLRLKALNSNIRIENVDPKQKGVIGEAAPLGSDPYINNIPVIIRNGNKQTINPKVSTEDDIKNYNTFRSPLYYSQLNNAKFKDATLENFTKDFKGDSTFYTRNRPGEHAYVYPHEFSHLSDFGGDLIPISDRNLIKQWQLHYPDYPTAYDKYVLGDAKSLGDQFTNKIITKDEYDKRTKDLKTDWYLNNKDKRYYSDKEMYETNFNKFKKQGEYNDDTLTNDLPYDDFIRKNKINFDPVDYKRYVGTNSEVRARINAARLYAKAAGIYDPFTERLTPEKYKELKKLFENQNLNEKDANQLRQLQHLYDDDEIINLMNTLSKNDSEIENDIQYGKTGGQLSKNFNIKHYPDGGPIIWVTDENDPRYKDYLIRQALYNYSNNPNFNLKNLAYYDLVRAIRKNDFKIFNDPSYYNTLLSTNYTNTYDDEFDRVYYEGLKDQNIGPYGSKVNYESILNDQLHSDPDYGDSYFSFKNEELSDPFFKTYPPNSWEKQTRFSSSPYIPNYAWTGSKWTIPNTTFIEDKINRERLKNVYPNLTDAEIDKYISEQREQPNFITNDLNSDGDFIHADIGNWDYANDKFIYLANPNKKTFIDNNRRLGYLQEQIEDDIRQDFDYVPIWSEPEQIVKILPPPIKIERPPLIKIDTNELREPSIPEAPQYTLEPYTDKRLRLVQTDGKTKWKTHRDRLGNGQKYKWTTGHSTKDLEFRRKEVVRPMAALVQKLTGYDPKYFEGYYDEEDNYVPGELDYGNLTGAKLEFKGAASLRDFINQQKYKKEYEEYVKKLSEAFDTKNSNSETSSLFKYIKGGTTCPEGFGYINGQCVPIVNDCEDEQCRETDQIQEIYNNALDIPRRVVDYEFGIEDLTNQKYAGNARLAWKSQGVKSFVEPSCMYVAGLGWRCAPATKEYMSHFDPVNFNSNIGFIHAVDRGDLPFTRVGKFSDKNFDDQSKGNMRIGDVVNFKGADNSHAETFVGYKEDGTPMYIDSNGNPSNYSTDSLWTPLRPNTTGKGRDYAYVNRFDTKRYVDDTHGEQIKELEKQARENPTYYEKGGLTKFFSGGPGDKYYKYNNTQYKKDQQGNWYKWNGKNWNLSGSGTYAYDMDNHIGLEDWLQAGRMQADDSNWSNDKPKATVSNYEIKRNKVLNNPFATTQQKIQATNSPLLGNVEIQQNLYKQQAEEAKQKELERQLEFEKQQQEEKQQQHFRTVGADNTLVDNSIVKNNAIYIPNVFEQTESIVKAQKDAARQIAMSGDLAKHFPELYEEYLSEENSNRKGGPLTLEEIALREIRKDGKTFFSTLESRKETAWKKAEQKKYDNLAWYEKGLNAAQAFIADPIMVTSNALFRGEGPMVGQGQWSIDPERFSAEDNYYYDKFSGKSNSTINNMLNIINVGRAGAGAGMALGEGNFGDATYELATVIPMVKGAKYGWKGLNALMKTQPLKYVPGLASTGWGAMTTGQALTGYGIYHAGAYDFPEAFDAYGKGDYGTGNEKAFMGLINSVPFIAEAKAGIPSFIDDTKVLSNKLFRGNTRPLQSTSTASIDTEKAVANSNLASTENSDFRNAINDKRYRNKFLSEEEAAALLRNQPNIKTIKYEGQSWPSEIAPELRTTDATKKEFESAKEFATQWAIQDPEKFNELGKQWSVMASESANLKNNPLLKVQSDFEYAFFDDWLKSQGYSKDELSQLAIDAFRSPEGMAKWDELFAEAQPFIQQQIASTPELANQYALSKRLNLKSAKLDEQLKEIPKLIEQTVDPVLKDKIKTLYEEAGMQMPEEIGVYNFGTVGADRNKLLFLKPGFEKSPEFLSLTPDDQAYILENWKNIGGVRTADATVTLGSKSSTTRLLREPQEHFLGYDEIVTPAPEFKVYDPRTWKNYGLKPTTTYEPKIGYLEGTDIEPAILENTIEYYKLPEDVGSVHAHEVGHDIQRLYDDWSNVIAKYDSTYGYYTGYDENAIAAEFKNAMVEPTLPQPTDTKGYTNETWKSSAKELHSELMSKRFQVTKYYMSTYPDMTLKDAINYVKELEAAGDPWLIDNFYLGENSTINLNKHFKPSTSIETKRKLIQMLPSLAIPLGLGIGYGMSQQESEESGTPKNKYGGNIKTLSKFIRK